MRKKPPRSGLVSEGLCAMSVTHSEFPDHEKALFAEIFASKAKAKANKTKEKAAKSSLSSSSKGKGKRTKNAAPAMV